MITIAEQNRVYSVEKETKKALRLVSLNPLSVDPNKLKIASFEDFAVAIAI